MPEDPITVVPGQGEMWPWSGSPVAPSWDVVRAKYCVSEGTQRDHLDGCHWDRSSVT